MLLRLEKNNEESLVIGSSTNRFNDLLLFALFVYFILFFPLLYLLLLLPVIILITSFLYSAGKQFDVHSRSVCM